MLDMLSLSIGKNKQKIYSHSYYEHTVTSGLSTRQGKFNSQSLNVRVWYYNPFASYAHPPIVRGHANVPKIVGKSHIHVVADWYPRISPSSGLIFATTGRRNVILYLKPVRIIIIIIVYFCRYNLHMVAV